MEKITSYVDDLMRNHELESELSEFTDSFNFSNFNLIGGSTDKDVPTGGFPHIFLCKEEDEEDKKQDKKKQEYKSQINSVSIKDIMQKRRNIKPFIKI